MLRFAMLSLICAITCGVSGYTGTMPFAWNWEIVLFVLFLSLSIAGFVGGTLPRPKHRPSPEPVLNPEPFKARSRSAVGAKRLRTLPSPISGRGASGGDLKPAQLPQVTRSRQDAARHFESSLSHSSVRSTTTMTDTVIVGG
ncbi:MAG: hypothetical protein NT069_28060 [Planctomycetota bacterium]|nr:hypothetical protein [Planctomycetota bacterium]